MIAGISRRRPERLEGKYWTERGTTGDIVLVQRLDAQADNYDEAQRLFDQVPMNQTAPVTAAG
jgi:hypothetical protein